MTIYTRRGDTGKTDLFSGERVAKTHPRVEACGAVDELNAVLGGLHTNLREQDPLAEEVARIQTELLQLGARLGTRPGTARADGLDADGVGITRAQVETLESAIDRMEDALPPLRGFIVPRGHPSAVWAHLARTVCRRAERRAVQIAEEEKEERAEDLRQAMVYLNRLSDYLFVLARTCNRLVGVAEAEWQG
jgi:cob(I)alamin adenosyltransferase